MFAATCSPRARRSPARKTTARAPRATRSRRGRSRAATPVFRALASYRASLEARCEVNRLPNAAVRAAAADVAAHRAIDVGALGSGFSRSATAVMICPDWQYPHCTTSASVHARCTGCEPSPEMP